MQAIISGTDRPVVRLAGRFDAHETSRYRDAVGTLPAVGGPSFDVDLAEVTFIDSSALAELVRSMKRAREAGGDVRLCRPSEPVRIILQLTGLHRAFEVVAS